MNINRGIWRLGIAFSTLWGFNRGLEFGADPEFQIGSALGIPSEILTFALMGIITFLVSLGCFRVLIWILDGFKKA